MDINTINLYGHSYLERARKVLTLGADYDGPLTRVLPPEHEERQSAL